MAHTVRWTTGGAVRRSGSARPRGANCPPAASCLKTERRTVPGKVRWRRRM